MRRLRRSIDIEAPPDVVWEHLTDFEAFPYWNPFIRRATGIVEEGQKIAVVLRILGKRRMGFEPTITKVQPGVELRWHAETVRQGILDVDRMFLLSASGPGTQLTQGEDCSGLLAPVIRPLGLERQILRGYERMNVALKKRAERSV